MTTDQDDALAERTVVFVGGLHRSGTTLLAKLLADHPDVSGLANTGVHEDEGQHLQDVYEPAKTFGGAGRFAFAPGAHLVEVDGVTVAAHRHALAAAWAPYWDTTKPILVEKSPPNLIRMRYLHSLFPRARFVVIVRHPVAVALATKKWRRRQPLWSLLKHWETAHAIARADTAAVADVLWIRYEDLVAVPTETVRRVLSFVGADPAAFSSTDAVTTAPSAVYAQKWTKLRAHPLGRYYVRALARRFAAAAGRYGYSITDIDRRDEWERPTE